MNYLRKKNKIILKYLIFIIFIVFVYGISYVITYFRFDDSINVEIEVLRNENERLQERIIDLTQALEINFDKYDYVMGKVVVRDIHNFYKEIVINRGSNDNIKKGMAVVNHDGLVAVVEKVEKNCSIARLLNSNYNVSVNVSNTYGNLSQGKIDLLNKYIEIKEGDLVYTSGLSYIPKGIYVGKINKISYDRENLGQEASVELIDNTNLNYVAIIVGEI